MSKNKHEFELKLNIRHLFVVGCHGNLFFLCFAKYFLKSSVFYIVHFSNDMTKFIKYNLGTD